METHFGKLIKMKSLTSEHISYAIYQVFRGLKYIHSAGVIHANIVILFFYIHHKIFILKSFTRESIHSTRVHKNIFEKI